MSELKEEFLDINDDVTNMNFNEDTSQTQESLEEQQTNSNNCIDSETLLRQLLESFEMEYLLPILKDADISYRNLRYLSVEDINAVIRSVGRRAEFREKLFAWRREIYKTNDITIEGGKKNVLTSENLVTLLCNLAPKDPPKAAPKDPLTPEAPSIPSTEVVAVVETATTTPTVQPAMLPGMVTFGLNKSLESILDSSQLGPAMKNFYKKYGYLERKHRDELIQIIINYIMAKDIKFHSTDFERVTNEIVSIFPSEAEARDYYFIRRQGKRNQTGRLYSKYNNTAKRRRFNNPSMDTVSSFSSSTNERSLEDEVTDDPGMDDTSLNAIKNFLLCDGVDWDDVLPMWKKTFQARQNDLKRCPNIKEFLVQWPKYLMPLGAELFTRDFNCKFPNKSGLLHLKWPKFKHKIFTYYTMNISNEVCKNLLAICASKPTKNVEDYLLTTLLNAVMPPAARYKDSAGTNKRKASIADAIEWFVLRIPNIEQLPKHKVELMQKYCTTDTEHVPYIVAIGESHFEISGFYVNFIDSLYKLPDFLSALEICLKIFLVFGIPYPATTSYTWTFIQRYFYDIKLPNDIKSPSLISLLSHMTHT